MIHCADEGGMWLRDDLDVALLAAANHFLALIGQSTQREQCDQVGADLFVFQRDGHLLEREKARRTSFERIEERAEGELVPDERWAKAEGVDECGDQR
jgi:hypothetical protein